MRTLIFLLFSVTIYAQSPDVLMVGNPPVAYTVVVEDNMINYPMGKAYPGKVHTVGDGFIFMDTHVPTGFYDVAPIPPSDYREGDTPHFRYYDADGHPRSIEVNIGNPQFYLPITPNFNGGWAWHVDCEGSPFENCVERYVRFGPGWNNDNWSSN